VTAHVDSSPSEIAPFADLDVAGGRLDATGSLAGSACPRCNGRDFPARQVCYRCGVKGQLPASVGSRGTLYSWTRVHISSTRPVPYCLGYVDIAEGLRVLGHLEGSEDWQPDEQVQVSPTESGWAFVRAGELS
jgi:uncharacterized protein